MKSIALDWTCMLVTVASLLFALGFSWHTLQPTSRGRQRQVMEKEHSMNVSAPRPEREPFLSDHAALLSRNSPQSITDLNQVVTKTLLEMPDLDYYHNGQSANEEQGERHLDDQCIVDLHIDVICEGCEEWVTQSRLQEDPFCYSELTEMTFRYTGCPCGSWHGIDYNNSTWTNATGQTSLVYECWKPTFDYNASDIPSEITCQDHTDPTLEAVDVEYNQGTSVQWVATVGDTTEVLGSGTVSVGQEYTIASSESSIVLPTIITMTFYDQDGHILQSTTFPTAYCPGYPDIWYRHGYSHMHVIGVQDLSSGTISTRDTVKKALWARVTVDASQSPVPVRLEELNLVANVNSGNINLTDAVNGVELGAWATVTKEGNTRNSRGRTSIHTLNHSRQEANGGSKSIAMMVGPMTIDMYWTTRYTFFGTIIARQSNNDNVECNGWDFQEHIAGLQ
jgi:hypothetical protein